MNLRSVALYICNRKVSFLAFMESPFALLFERFVCMSRLRACVHAENKISCFLASLLPSDCCSYQTYKTHGDWYTSMFRYLIFILQNTKWMRYNVGFQCAL
jgi:hypothetical protein